MQLSSSYRVGANAALEKLAGQRLDRRMREALERMGVSGGNIPQDDFRGYAKVYDAGTSRAWENLAHDLSASRDPSHSLRLRMPPQNAFVNGFARREADPTMTSLQDRFNKYKFLRERAGDYAHSVLRSRQELTGNAIASGYWDQHRALQRDALWGRNSGLADPYAAFADRYVARRRLHPNTSPDTLRGAFLNQYPEKSFMRRALEDERVVYNVPKGRSYLLSRASDMVPSDVPKQTGFGAGRIFYKGGPITSSGNDPAWVSSSPGVSAGYGSPSGNTPGLLQWFNGRDLENPITTQHNGKDTRGATLEQARAYRTVGASEVGQSHWYESVVGHDALGTPGPMSKRNNRPAQGPSSRAIGHAAVGPYGVHVLGGVDPFKPDGSVARSIQAQGTPGHLVQGGWVPPSEAVKPSGAGRYLMAENPPSAPLPWSRTPAPAVPGPSMMSRLGGWLRRGLRRGR